ncbi:MAG: L,D-transpeptidase [Solirubrobacteraceae bacterium]
MGRRRRLAIVALLLTSMAAGVALNAPGDRDSPARAAAEPAAQPRAPAKPRVPAGPLAARVLRRTQLRSSPGGSVVKTIGTKTRFDSKQTLAVVRRRGDWLGVLSDHVPNSRTAWIPAASAELEHVPYRLDVDLSARRLVVRHEGRVVRRMNIAIGRPHTPTPTGRFAVTDGLRITGTNAYGCCALALTATQSNLPQGWAGGDRIAIHGTGATGSIGSPASAGCMRALDSEMRWLLPRIKPGVQVRIRA